MIPSFQFRVQLILPSGLNYTYITDINETHSTVELYNYFWSHATELGNYTIIAEVAYLSNMDVTATNTLVFDPPGGTDEDEPIYDVASL